MGYSLVSNPSRSDIGNTNHINYMIRMCKSHASALQLGRAASPQFRNPPFNSTYGCPKRTGNLKEITADGERDIVSRVERVPTVASRMPKPLLRAPNQRAPGRTCWETWRAGYGFGLSTIGSGPDSCIERSWTSASTNQA